MDNQRLILALVFGFSLMMLWSAWQKQSQPQPVVQSVPATTSTPAAGPGAGSVPAASGIAAPSSGTPSLAAPAAVATPSAATVTATSDLMVAEISAQGGDLVRLELTRHKEDKTQSLMGQLRSLWSKVLGEKESEDEGRNFVLFDAKHSYAAQSGLTGGLPNHKTVWQLPAERLDLKNGENDLRVRLTAPVANGVEVSKTYIFHRDSYLVDLEYDISNQSTNAVTPEAYFQLSRDGKALESSGSMMSSYTGPAFFTEADNFQKVEFGDIAKNKAKIPGNASNGWVAMVQHYFVSAWLPADGPTRQFYAEELGSGSNLFRAGIRLPMPAIVPGATGKLTVGLYAGPQEQQNLAKIANGFGRVVDYGNLTVIAAPIFWVLNWLHSFTGNWGWAIILMTIMLKAVFFPLSAASYKSMAKMRLVTPKMQKIKETFADDRERMNREMMELYKKEKVNPLGGCLPIVVQIPVFIALYWVLAGTVEMRGAPWLGWITDLSNMDPYFVMPLIMGATMLIQTKLNPTPPDPMQAKIMLLMPIVFTVMFLSFPSGLVLYWTVNNLLSIAQQWQVNRMIEASGLKSH
jgi:YidC/Oxa1 family membrane protein insertase